MKKLIPFLLLVNCLFAFAQGTKAQIIQTIAGTGGGGISGDGGPAILANIEHPYGIAVDDTGNLYVCQPANSCIRKIKPGSGGIITRVAGNTTLGTSGDGGGAIYAQIEGASDVAVDRYGNIYIPNRNCIRKIDATGIINTIAGTGVAGFYGDGGPATLAKLNNVLSLAVDTIGNIYFVDRDNNRIRKVDTAGIINTIAGTGLVGFSPDGFSAISASLNGIDFIKADKTGNVFFGDNFRIRKINPTGILSTIAGNGTIGSSGDGGMATDAEIKVGAIAIDTSGNLYFACGDGNQIRKVNTTGIINLVAGNGICGFAGDGGNPLLAELCGTTGIAVYRNGDIFISDVINNRIRLVTTQPLSLNYGLNNAGGISISPNPIQEAFTCLVQTALEEPVNITIFDLLGNKVMERTGVTNMEIDLQLKVAPGIYMITASTQHQQFRQKIIVE